MQSSQSGTLRPLEGNKGAPGAQRARGPFPGAEKERRGHHWGGTAVDDQRGRELGTQA